VIRVGDPLEERMIRSVALYGREKDGHKALHYNLIAIVNASRKMSLRGAKRRGNLRKLLHFVRNDSLGDFTYLRRSL
jgi:hypothetical protein